MLSKAKNTLKGQKYLKIFLKKLQDSKIKNFKHGCFQFNKILKTAGINLWNNISFFPVHNFFAMWANWKFPSKFHKIVKVP